MGSIRRTFSTNRVRRRISLVGLGGALPAFDLGELFGSLLDPGRGDFPAEGDEEHDLGVRPLAEGLGVVEGHELGVAVVADGAPLALAVLDPGNDHDDVSAPERRQRDLTTLERGERELGEALADEGGIDIGGQGGGRSEQERGEESSDQGIPPLGRREDAYPRPGGRIRASGPHLRFGLSVSLPALAGPARSRLC